MIFVGTYNDFLIEGLENILDTGDKVQSRAGMTKEITNFAVTVTHNKLRDTFIRGRGNNPIATVVETLWVLCGCDNIEFLSWYLPRAKEYSDDGRTWTNAYGKRLRNWHGVDQIQQAYLELKNNPESRRCVMGINDPLYCLNRNSKDVACNLVLNFWIREGSLNLTVMSRSMDIIFGSQVNFYEWSVLQELLARWLGVDSGNYTHFVTSLHLYEPYFEKAKNIVTDYREFLQIQSSTYMDSWEYKIKDLRNIGFNSSRDIHEDLKMLLFIHHKILVMSERGIESSRSVIEEFEQKIISVESWFDYAIICMVIGYYLKEEVFNIPRIRRMVSRLPESIQRVVVVEYLTRVLKDRISGLEGILSKKEMELFYCMKGGR